MTLLRDLCLLVIFIALLQAYMQRHMRSGVLPELTLKTLSGADSERLISHKPAIIYFWGSWCGICTAMQSTISSVLQDYSGISVALRSGNNAVISLYMQDHALDWQVINDQNGHIAKSFGVSAVPAVFIVGSDGQIRFVTLGYVTQIGLRLRLWSLKSGF